MAELEVALRWLLMALRGMLTPCCGCWYTPTIVVGVTPTVVVGVTLAVVASSITSNTLVGGKVVVAGSNFHLGVLDLDLALLSEKPDDLTDASTTEQRSFHKAWERSNKLSLMFIRMAVEINIKSTFKKTECVKEFMNYVEESSQSDSDDKSLVGTLMGTLTNMKFNGSGIMHEHYSTFHVNYNTLKDKWNVHELQRCTFKRKQGLRNKEIIQPISLVIKELERNHGRRMERSSKDCQRLISHLNKSRRRNQARIHAFFRKAWFENKGKLNALVCFKSNLAEVPHNTWWIDSDCTTHDTNMMQRFLTTRTISQNENFIFMGNGVKALVEAIGTV
ncbi:hypothetical protein V2J09_000883 [Rumex salicifolius]